VKHPTISIIIPAYNAATIISGTVSPVLDQGYKDLELILVNDGSTDDTLKVLEELQGTDRRITVLDKKNGGPSSARNKGLDKATGTYVIFVDADDSITPTSINTLVTKITKSDNDVVVGGWQTNMYIAGELIEDFKKIIPIQRVIDGSSQEIKKEALRSIGQNGETYNLWNKIFKNEIIRKNKLRFNEDLNFGEDLLFIFDYLEHCKSIEYISDIVYIYTSGSPTSTFSKSALAPKNREVNAAALEEYISAERDQELADLAGWVQWRWILSFYLLICASGLSLREKWSLFSQELDIKLTVAKNGKHIGQKKLFIERSLQLLQKNTYLLFFCIWVLSLFRWTVVRVKSRLRKR
jgi:glycosyltransferase involved in cell wall biosynthesis